MALEGIILSEIGQRIYKFTYIHNYIHNIHTYIHKLRNKKRDIPRTDF